MNNKKGLRTIFMGSGNFAVPILEGLLEEQTIDLKAVISQPDKPVGRKQVLTPPPVKQALIGKKVDILQPKSIKVIAENMLSKYDPELVIVADYGQLIPKNIIDYPLYKCLNVHGSLLPDLRGATPIPVAILRGYSETGVSIPIMTPGLDDGPIVSSEVIPIQDTDTTESLTVKMADIGANLLVETIPNWVAGKIIIQQQDESKATFTSKEDIAKENAKFDADISVKELERAIRAFYPWPVSWTYINWNGKKLRLKIFAAEVSSNEAQSRNTGEIVYESNSLKLILSSGVLDIKELQLEGKKRGTTADYIFLKGQHSKLV